MTAGIPLYALDAGATHGEDEGAVGVGVGVGVGGAGAGESPPSFGGPNRFKRLRSGYVRGGIHLHVLPIKRNILYLDEWLNLPWYHEEHWDRR